MDINACVFKSFWNESLVVSYHEQFVLHLKCLSVFKTKAGLHYKAGYVSSRTVQFKTSPPLSKGARPGSYVKLFHSYFRFSTHEWPWNSESVRIISSPPTCTTSHHIHSSGVCEEHYMTWPFLGPLLFRTFEAFTRSYSRSRAPHPIPLLPMHKKLWTDYWSVTLW